MAAEPKYQLNKKDKARWMELLTRHCLDFPSTSKRLRKLHPPLSTAEAAEFERLTCKRRTKLAKHPRMKLALAAQRARDRRLRQLERQLDAVLSPEHR